MLKSGGWLLEERSNRSRRLAPSIKLKPRLQKGRGFGIDRNHSCFAFCIEQNRVPPQPNNERSEPGLDDCYVSIRHPDQFAPGEFGPEEADGSRILGAPRHLTGEPALALVRIIVGEQMRCAGVPASTQPIRNFSRTRGLD